MTQPPRLVRIDLDTFEETPISEAEPAFGAEAVRQAIDGSGTEGRFPVKHGKGGITRPEHLPVLEAFQQYLQAERRKARLRMAAICAFFTLLIACLVGGGLFAGLTYMNQVGDDVWQLAENVRDWQQNAIASDTAQSRNVERIDSLARNLRNDVEDTRLFAASARAESDERVQAYENRLDQLRLKIRELESENATLKQDLTSVSKGLPEMHAALQQLEARLAALPTDTRIAGGKQVDRQRARSASTTLVTPVFARERGVTVPLRLPIPE